jgi:dipeptidyl aminopeptidase/acylaminoacyl peptidase
MKSRIFLLVLLFLVLGFPSKTLTLSQPFEIIEIDIGGEPNNLPTGEPQWSPDGTKLAFVSEGWLCVADVDGKKELKKIAKIGRSGFTWSDFNEFAICEYERDSSGAVGIHKTLTLQGEEKLIRKEIIEKESGPKISGLTELPDGTLGYYEPFVPSAEKKIFHIIRPGKLKPEDALKQMKVITTKGYVGWGPIILESVDGTVKKGVTKGEATFSFPKLSPDGTKLTCKNHRGEILVFDLNGNLLANLGKGSFAQWSPNSRQIAFHLTVESEFDIEASDIYIISSDGTERTQLTNTPDIIEMYPSWSPDGTKIACKSLRTGKIFVIKLK